MGEPCGGGWGGMWRSTESKDGGVVGDGGYRGAVVSGFDGGSGSSGGADVKEKRKKYAEEMDKSSVDKSR